ncbi:energy-coupled thiamine transporter ThiT [Salicibibacter kimchii]|uniref:Energy-coupled thiamine transporter ThiT n=1 Tax=Salicibibacter kimchii TaxID=2099786 RepID=A0A345BVQ6_9BACI|nr:energy-coupled thiamine transporter ThiT [Salicibibacter kimchii]AXF55037.1 energy-coupled thiamine transporter ThiT [Salicibibacter kimchii]
MQKRTLIMVEIALMTALAFMLSFVKFPGPWVQGGSISLIMVPIFIMAFRRGWRVGVLTGALVGIVNLMYNASIIHPIQMLLDYPVPYAVLGLAALFAFQNSEGELSVGWALIGLLFAGSLRFLSHVISGIVWFGSFTPEGMNVYLYSIGYNISYLLPEILITLVVLYILSRAQPDFFQMKKTTPVVS